MAGVDTPERDASEDEAHADAEAPQQTLKAPANAPVSMVPEVAGTTSPASAPSARVGGSHTGPGTLACLWKRFGSSRAAKRR